jgi:FkbM family methyltransferase
MKMIEAKGIRFFVRDEQPAYDDLFTVNEVITENCYKMTPDQVKDKVVVDIGSNIGDFALLSWKWGAEKVIAVEPEPHNLKMLRMNIAVNNADIQIIDKAVGKKGFAFIDDGSGHSRTDANFGNEVEVIELNEILKDLPKVDVLKMDCEGGEYEAIETATDATLDKIQRIVGELHSWRWEEDPERHKNLIKRLESFFDMHYYGFKDSSFWGRRLIEIPIPCSKLKDGKCSIYKTRPDMCKEFDCEMYESGVMHVK